MQGCFWATSVLPKSLEALGRQLGVADGVLDVLAPHVRLQAARTDSVIGQLVAARMAQHVGVDAEPKAGSLAKPGHRLAEAGSGERCAALRYEHVWRLRAFPLQLAQRAQLPTCQRMRGRRAAMSIWRWNSESAQVYRFSSMAPTAPPLLVYRLDPGQRSACICRTQSHLPDRISLAGPQTGP